MSGALNAEEVNLVAPPCTRLLFARRAFILTSRRRRASCIYPLLTKLHYHYLLQGAGTAPLTDVTPTNIQQLLLPK